MSPGDPYSTSTSPMGTETPLHHSSNNPSDDGAGSGDPGSPNKTKVSRKRTKTGCLTCRKRRIKCGEEKPTCNNCIKSKRICEGYTQRVVFKDFRHPGSVLPPGMVPQQMMGPGGRAGFAHAVPRSAGPQSLQPIAPAPQGYRRENSLTPMDESAPPHLREYWEQRQHRDEQYVVPNISVPLSPMDPASFPNTPQESYESYQPKTSPHSQFGGDYYNGMITSSPPFIPPHTTSAHDPGYSIAAPGSSHYPPPEPQYSAPSPSSSYVTSPQIMPAASIPVTSCPFNPPLDPRYAMVSGNQAPAQDYGYINQRRSPQVPVTASFYGHYDDSWNGP